MNCPPTETLSREQSELLELLSGELQEQVEASLNPSDTDPGDRLYQAATLADNLGKAAEHMGLDGLAEVCQILHGNFAALTDQPPSPDEDLAALVGSWPLYLLDYVQRVRDGALDDDSLGDLLSFVTDAAWPHPLPEVRRSALTERLRQSRIETVPNESASRLPTHATLEMLSMTLGDDVNAELLEGLMAELPGQVNQFAEQIQRLVVDNDREALAQAQRIAHTIKGSGNVVGIRGLANFTHFSEDLLDLLDRDTQPISAPLGRLLVDVADTLAGLLDCLLEGQNPGPADLAVMQQLLDYYHRLHAGESLDLSNDQDYSPADHQQKQDPAPVADTAADPDTTAEAPEHHARQGLQESLASQLRVGEETAQELLRLAGESAIGTNRLLTQAQVIRQQLQFIGQLHHKLTHLSEEFGQLIEVRNLFGQTPSQGQGDLDPLELDHYNELHSFFHQLQEVGVDTRDAIQQAGGEVRSLEELAIEQQRTNRDSQEHLLAMRMVPAKTLEARFQRCVRQAGRLTGKPVELLLTGGETLIDARVLHGLVDPLMHLLRNAVDHGIEPPDVRQARGKPETGHIELHFGIQGKAILVQVTDDGAGLNRERIAARAEELGINAPTTLSAHERDAWLNQLIFTAGFSTRAQVSQTSGRGIGLDVAAQHIAQLKGRIDVRSEYRAGCELRLLLPMTVIAEHQLLVASGPHQMALASRGVEQVLFLEPDSLQARDGQLFCHYHDRELDVFPLAQLARFPDTAGAPTAEARALLIVEHLPQQRCGILLERVMASREMVIKPLSPVTPSPPGTIGATILGDGQVAPVVDIQQLAAEHAQTASEGRRPPADLVPSQPPAGVPERPVALVVDDSLSIRRSLAQFVGDLGLEVRTARDGFEAIEIIRDITPTLLLVDMEMPRMNGLELTAHVRALDTGRRIPVIMITSRNTEKHRRLASAAGVDTYLNKPFSEDELMHHIQESMSLCPTIPASA